MDAAPAYTVHEGDVARDRDTVLALWRGNLGQDARMAAKYDWFYRDSPAGPPLLLLLRHEASGDWVGVAGAGPRRFRHGGVERSAGVLVDLAVLPAHRSLGPALTLQQTMLERGLARFDLLYGFPNPKAVPVFKRVGYGGLGALTRMLRVLRHGAYLHKRLPALPGALAQPTGWLLDLIDRVRLALPGRGLHGEWSQQAPAELDALWAGSDPGTAPLAVRDGAFARWRFDACPLAQTRHLLVRDRAGRARAWFACQWRDGVLLVADAWSDGGAAGIPPDCIAVLLRAARAQGAQAVSVEVVADGAGADGWRARGFVAREQRPVYGKTGAALADAGATALPWLSSADEDE
jgi:hypothetical protein